jgi:hypothetical protein
MIGLRSGIMTEERRTPKDVGKDSPASESAKQQRMSGTSGGAQASQESGSGKQPPQTSGRRDPRHEHEGTVRKGYDAAQDPQSQGDGDPGPEQIRDSEGIQGHGGAGGTGRTAKNEDVTERSQAGEPQGRHTASGRQNVPGDRDPQQPD